ncbi:MAG: glycosyltransferase family 39 protein [Bacteroidia bacterium]
MEIKSYISKASAAKWGVFLLFCLYLYFPVFLHLNTLPIHLWDEALFGLRALHFLKFGEYMVNFNHFEGMPDYLSTKLPFTTFFQVAGLKIFGINELGLRLPISFIFLGTVFYGCYFSRKYLGSILPGIVAGVVLVSSTGVVTSHMLRTGDHDIPFACYLFLGILFFHRFLNTDRSALLVAFTICMIAAFLTKNLLTGLIFPGLLAYTLYRRSFVKMLRDYRIYLSLLAIAGSYVGTILYIENISPGFWARMWDHDLMGRYKEPIHGHEKAFFYYYYLFVNESFVPFSYFMLAAIALSADRNMNKNVQQLLVLNSLVFVFYLLGISLAETKLPWYLGPLYFMGAFITGLGIYHLWASYIIRMSVAAQYSLLVAALILVIPNYAKIIGSIYLPEPTLSEQKYGIFIERISKDFPEVDTMVIADKSFGPAAYFIKEEYNALEQFNISYQKNIEFNKGEYVITCFQSVLKVMEQKYDIKLLNSWQECSLIKIQREKLILDK